MINRKSAREIKLKNIIQAKLNTYSAKLPSSSFSSRNHSNSKGPKSCIIGQSKEKKGTQSPPLKTLELRMVQNLNQYNCTITFFYTKIINDIIYDEKKHIVCLFKNYLLWDEVSDFLKRFYQKTEAIQRLPKITGYYEKYTLFAPVYYQLDCIKLMMKNTKRKKRYLEMIEDNEDRMENEDEDEEIGHKRPNVKEFNNIIKPEDVFTNETKQSMIKDRENNDKEKDLSLTINSKDCIMLSNAHNGNINFSHLMNNITMTSIMSNMNKYPYDNDNDDISQSFFHNDQYINLKKDCKGHRDNKHKIVVGGDSKKKTKGIEIKKLNFNKIKGFEQESEVGRSKSKKMSNNNLQEKINGNKRPMSNHLTKKNTNHNVHHIAYETNHKNQKNNNNNDGDIKQIIQSSLTATLKAKHKNRIIKDKVEKFTSLDNLFKIIQFPIKQSITDNNNSNNNNNGITTTKSIASNALNPKSFTAKIDAMSKIKDPPNKPNTIFISNTKTTTKTKKSNLVINHNTIKNQKPTLTLRNDSSLRDESSSHSQVKYQSKSQSRTNSIKKKLAPNFGQKTKYINPLSNTLANYSKQILTPKSPNDKMVISSVIPQSIYNINHKSNVHFNTNSKRNTSSNTNNSKGKQNKNILSDSLNNNNNTNSNNNNNAKMKKSIQTIATATANSTNNKEKISDDLNNLHISINKQINASLENNTTSNNNNNNPTLSKNTNCKIVNNQQKDNKEKEKICFRLPEKKISRNDNNAIEKLQSSHSHTNKIKNMVIPINSGNGKDYKGLIKDKDKDKNIKTITRHYNNKQGPLSLSKEKKKINHYTKNNDKLQPAKNNEGHEISMSLTKNKKDIIDQTQRKYPLTSRNEKECIPAKLLNKIMKKN